MMANCGLPTSAIPSSTEMARMMSAEYGGMRKGNSYLVRVRVRVRVRARVRLGLGLGLGLGL